MQKGFLNIAIVLVAAVIIFGIGGYVLVSKNSPRTEEQMASAPKIALSEGFGNLCSSGEKCKIFCKNNLGRCKEYCGNHPENKICQKPFSFGASLSKPKKTPPLKKCVSNPSPVFTAPFTDITKIREISPIGHAFINNPGSPSRSYVSVKSNPDGSRGLAPLYAPIDSTLTSIAYANRNYGALGTRAEYRLDFQVSCEVKYTFDHIANIIDKLKDLAPKVPAGNTRSNAYLSVPIKAGELLGYTDGTLVAGGFDFLVVNSTNKEKFINPSRWVSNEKYGTCPYNYFIPELKDQYYALLQKTRSSDTKASCRTVSRDIPGTLAGGWFQGNATDKAGNRLVIATVSTDMIDLVIMNGDQPTLFRDYTNPDVLKPEDVTVGKSVCYYDKDRNIYAYLKLLSETEMALAMGAGICPFTFPETGVQNYSR